MNLFVVILNWDLGFYMVYPVVSQSNNKEPSDKTGAKSITRSVIRTKQAEVKKTTGFAKTNDTKIQVREILKAN